MIRSNIFGLPSLIAAHLGKLSLAGYLVAFAGMAVIAACPAEVASQFQEAGGPCMRQLFSLPEEVWSLFNVARRVISANPVPGQ